MTLSIRSATPDDERNVVALWRVCDLVASYNDPVVDFRFAKDGSSSDVLVAEDESGLIVGSVMVGHDGHRGWLYYVSAAPQLQGSGIGRQIVQAAEEWLRQRGVLKAQTLGAGDKHQGDRILRAPWLRHIAANRDGEVAWVATRQPRPSNIQLMAPRRGSRPSSAA